MSTRPQRHCAPQSDVDNNGTIDFNEYLVLLELCWLVAARRAPPRGCCSLAAAGLPALIAPPHHTQPPKTPSSFLTQIMSGLHTITLIYLFFDNTATGVLIREDIQVRLRPWRTRRRACPESLDPTQRGIKVLHDANHPPAGADAAAHVPSAGVETLQRIIDILTWSPSGDCTFLDYMTAMESIVELDDDGSDL